MENKSIIKAIIAVMRSVQNIDKSLTVGTGRSSYQGVPDKEVKLAFNKAMTENGLCIVPTEIIPKTRVDRWEQTDQYGTKQKQSVFTEVTTKYLLLHESGESLELAGYGHGVDSQDKGAGKATTYALKYTLLYSFMTATGKIDDADTTHSEEIESPQNGVVKANASASDKEDKEVKELFDTPIKRVILKDEAEKDWDGVILEGKYVMILGKKIEPPAEQIEKLKKLPNYKK